MADGFCFRIVPATLFRASNICPSVKSKSEFPIDTTITYKTLHKYTKKKEKKCQRSQKTLERKKKLVKGKKRYTLGSKPSRILFSSLHDKFEILSPKAPKHKQCSGAKFSRYIWNESAFNGDH